MDMTVFEAVMEVFNKIDSIRRDSLCDSVNVTYHGHKNYYDIVFKFRHGNAKYEDCVIIYCEEDFNKDNILVEISLIVDMAKKTLV